MTTKSSVTSHLIPTPLFATVMLCSQSPYSLLRVLAFILTLRWYTLYRRVVGPKQVEPTEVPKITWFRGQSKVRAQKSRPCRLHMRPLHFPSAFRQNTIPKWRTTILVYQQYWPDYQEQQVQRIITNKLGFQRSFLYQTWEHFAAVLTGKSIFSTGKGIFSW